MKEVKFCNEQQTWWKPKKMTIWSLHWRAISSTLNSYLTVQLFTTNVKNNNVGCHRLCKTFKWHCSLDNIRGDFEYFLTHAILLEETVKLKPCVKKCYIHYLHSFCIYFCTYCTKNTLISTLHIIANIIYYSRLFTFSFRYVGARIMILSKLKNIDSLTRLLLNSRWDNDISKMFNLKIWWDIDKVYGSRRWELNKVDFVANIFIILVISFDIHI